MPVFAADVLPDATGRNLGSPPQRWNLFVQNLDIQGNVNYQPVPGANLGQSGVLFVQTLPVTANANTTGWQTLESCVVPAGLLNAAGKTVRATLAGYYVTQAAQTPYVIIQVGFGTLQIFYAITPAINASETNYFRGVFEVTVYTPGTAGQIISNGILHAQTNAPAETTTPVISAIQLSGPVDFTAPVGMTCHCQFQTNTSPANTCTQNQFIVEVLN